MPATSKKQLRYINAAAERGEISESVRDEFNRTSKGKKLPERAPKKGAKGSLRAWAERKLGG